VREASELEGFPGHPSLFDQPGPSHHDDPETSKAAGRLVVGSTRLAILRAFIGADLTDDEAGERAHVTNYSQRRRCSELRSWGLIEPTGLTRPTNGGSRGMVSRITEAGRQALR